MLMEINLICDLPPLEEYEKELQVTNSALTIIARFKSTLYGKINKNYPINYFDI